MGNSGLKSGVGRVVFLLEALREGLSPFFFQILETACLPWLLALFFFLFKANHSQSVVLTLNLSGSLEILPL